MDSAEKKTGGFDEGLLPVWLSQRNMSWLGYVWIWVGLCVVIVTFQYGANAVMGGFTLLESALIITVANFGLAIIMTFTSDIGTEHGLPFAAYLRAPFGYKGVHIAAVSRGIVAACWFGIQSYLGAIALNGIIVYLTGFDSWPLWYALFIIVQVLNVALGIKAIEHLAAIAAPVILVISVWMYFTINNIAAVNGINIWKFAAEEQTLSLVFLFIVNMTVWSPMALDSCNLTRWLKIKPGRDFFGRNRATLPAHFITLPVVHAWIAFIGAISWIATGLWNPIEVIQTQRSGFILIAMLVLIVFAQWSTNITGAVLPAALTFMNAGNGKIGYRTAILLSGVVGTVIMPWALLSNLFTFLGYYGGFLGSLAGIMVCDYFCIRRRRLNVPDLFDTNGQYAYDNGWNWGAIIAFAAPAVVSFFNLEWAYFIGLFGGFVLYYILMKAWILPKYPQAEVTSGFSDDYLATSLNLNWVYDKETGTFSRVETEKLPDVERVV